MRKSIWLRMALCLLCAGAMLVGLTACAGAGKEKQDTSPLTMYVGLGLTNSAYYDQLHELILSETGIDVQYVFSNTLDTTNAIRSSIEHYDLPADIVVTSSATPVEAQKNAFLDLAAYTNVPDRFSTTKMQSVSVDGAIYQLPFSTRLIGVEYNKTLFDEMGWTVPESFEEMLELKEKATAAGYLFAVAGGAATGHGFNYLMHLCGSDYLSTPDGTEWLHDFQSGEADIAPFAEQADYFRRYAEAGLFGRIHTADWNAKTDFCRERALFYYNIVNDAYSYDGFRYTAEGTLYGAQYGADGQPMVKEDPKGNAVLKDGEYVLYNEADETLQGLTRYTIPGAVELHDTYASMPWVSEFGSTNCFTSYDNMYLALDKKLGDSERQEKLAQATKVLELMATQQVADLFTALHPDGYVSLAGFRIDATRLYYPAKDRVEKGYLMPWYYNDFDTDSIVNVGQLVNDYLSGEAESSLDAILTELDTRNQNALHSEADIAALVSEEFDFPATARLEAAAAALSLQQTLDAGGFSDQVTVSLLPYTEALDDLPIAVRVGVVQAKLYAGPLQTTLVRSLVSGSGDSVIPVRMSGKELNRLLDEGFTVAGNDGDVTFPYASVVKGGGEISDAEEYLVSVPKTLADRYQTSGQVLTDAEGSPISGSVEAGLMLYFETRDTVSPDSIDW